MRKISVCVFTFLLVTGCSKLDSQPTNSESIAKPERELLTSDTSFVSEE